MTKNREELRVEMLRKAEAMIDDLLDWREKTDAPDFDQIEKQVLHLRQEISLEMGQELLASETATTPADEVECPTCKQPMRYKGVNGKQVSSLLGTLKLQRAYYYCSGCQRGHFPPGSTDETDG